MSVPRKPIDQSRIVALLAEESRVPIDDVATLYERECAELALGAHNTTFLHIFTIRNVQEILRARSLDQKARTLSGSAGVAA